MDGAQRRQGSMRFRLYYEGELRPTSATRRRKLTYAERLRGYPADGVFGKASLPGAGPLTNSAHFGNRLRCAWIRLAVAGRARSLGVVEALAQSSSQQLRVGHPA